jgi:hypothetical protein
MDRYRGQIRKAVERAIENTDIENIGSEGIDVVIPKRDISEPSIHHGKGGVTDRVLPGNKEYYAGDRLGRPKGGGGGGNGSGAGQDGGGEDDFIYQMSAEEVENFIFQDLELPNMTKRAVTESKQTKPKRSGHSSSGTEQDRDFVRSKKEKLKRMVASIGPMNEKILVLLQEKRDILANATGPSMPEPKKGWVPRKIQIRNLMASIEILMDQNWGLLNDASKARLDALDDEIEAIEKRKTLVPVFNETTDSRYRNRVQKPVPISKAVMFCVMDVSGSMDQETKNNAKLFYSLLYRFLKRHYEKTEVVFIRHHTEADEVDEQTFFYDRTTGGTIVSTALEKMKEVMQERYPEAEWNIYGAQASDGDNWDSDNPKCDKLLREILPKVQGYFYTEITKGPSQSLWRTYEKLAAQFQDRFWMANIKERRQVATVFREFFKKRVGETTAPSSLAYTPSGPN